MTYFLAVQGTYASLGLALFCDWQCLEKIELADIRASSNLVPLIQDLLTRNNLALQDLSFIAVDKGPGAFTSLRAVIASINGIAYASAIPLIAVNSLEALVAELKATVDREHGMVAAVLNAYGNDVYFRLARFEDLVLIEEGCEKAETVKAKLSVTACVGGNGAHLLFPEHSNLFVQLPSVTTIAQLALTAWMAGDRGVQEIEPHYLKTQLFAIKR